MTVDNHTIFALYMESQAGTISPEDAAMLRQQLASDNAARELWEALEQEGDQTGIQKFIDELQPAQELELLKEKMQYRVPGKGAVIRRITRYVAVAAAAVVLLTAGWLVYKNRKITDTQAIAALVQQHKDAVRLQLGTGAAVDIKPGDSTQQLAIGDGMLSVDSSGLSFTATDTAINTLSIPQGQTYSLTLSDGTVVTLNADSKLKFPFRFAGATREVSIEGEAYFKVAKDTKHPFIVHTPLTNVQVVGTMFNINTYKKETIATTLVEGKVLTGVPGGTQQALSPGHAAIYNPAKGFDIEEVDINDAIAWMQGVYYFHDMPLRDLVVLMSRTYGASISLENTAIANKSVSGIMDRSNLPELLEDLKTTVGIKYNYSGQALHIY